MNNETFQKKSITMYAKKIREIQSTQIDPYIELIEEQLLSLYPQLEHNEDNATNWAYDIINCSTNTEVMETLERIDQILEREYKDKWKCCICGENTYNVDIDYLSGVDHLSCILKEEIKQDDNKNQVQELKNQLNNLQNYVKQLEQQLNKLEDYYDEPAN